MDENQDEKNPTLDKQQLWVFTQF